MPQNPPAAITMLKEACAALDDAQRIALANELVRHVQSEHCVLQLRGLATVATETAHELARRGHVRRVG